MPSIEGKLYLIGFMGTGKSSVGRLLAEELGLSFYDLDEEIERERGPISSIFNTYGEERFRKWEGEMLQRIAYTSNPAVVSTGGGIVLRERNWKIMRETGYIVSLVAKLGAIEKRIGGTSNSRPLASNKERLRDLYYQRSDLYKRADLILETSDKSIEEVAEEVLNRLKRRKR